MLLHRDSPISRQQLSFLFWPDSKESQARTNLRNLIHKLRSAFPELDSYLEVGQGSLEWNPDPPLDLDLDIFHAAVEQADQTGSGVDHDAHRQALLAVSDAYPGDLLPSCYENWIIPYREENLGAYLEIIEELVATLEDSEEYDQAIQQARKWVRIDPISETAYQALMQLYINKGDKARAVRTYHQCVEVLEKEMGMDPGADLQRLYQRVMERDIASPDPPRVTEKQTRLIGRDQAWNQLQRVWMEHESGAHLVAIMGEAGIGKTYMIDELVRWARNSGFTCLRTRSHATADQLAYTPVTALLRDIDVQDRISHLEEGWLVELARFLPELRDRFPDLPDPDRVSEAWKRSRLFEASIRAITVNKSRLFIVLDDLHWCDRETLDWLRTLVAFPTETKIMVVTGLRTEDLLADSPLIPFFTELGKNNQITELLLDRFDEETTTRLAADIWGEEIDHRTSLRLFQETEGNPLFVAEMVRGGYLQDSGAASDYKSMPPRVQAVIESRLNALNPESRELAALASVVGRAFDYELLMQTGEQEEDQLLRGLDELWSRRLIKDQGDRGYDFSHDKFREVLYGEVSPHRRIHYHKKIAAALEQIHTGQLEIAAPRIAFQYQEAGDKGKALDYYILSGDQSRLVHSLDEAIEYYQAGETLLPKKASEKGVLLYSGLGNALFKQASYDDSINAYQDMVKTASKLGDPIQEAQAWLALAKVRDQEGKHQEALDSAQQAADIAEQKGSEAELANATMMLGQQYYRLGQPEDGEPLVQKAMSLHEGRKDKLGVGRCLSMLGLIQDERGNFKEARKLKEQALEIFDESTDPHAEWWVGIVTFNLGNSASLKGEFSEAVKYYDRAKDVMQRFQDHNWYPLSLFGIGAARVGLKEYEEAEDVLGEILEITEGVGWLGLALTYYFLAESYLGQGQIKYAEKAAFESLDLSDESGVKTHRGAALRTLGKICAQKDDPVEHDGQTYSAEDCFKESEKIYRDVGAEDELAHTLKAWAEVEISSGNEKAGKEKWSEARGIFQKLEMPAEVERMDNSDLSG